MSMKMIGSNEIRNHPDLVKFAQGEFVTMDRFLCGRCFNKFYFCEEFKQHTEVLCNRNSLHYTLNANISEFYYMKEAQLRSLSLDYPSNANIWGFLLWKAALLNRNEELRNTTLWSLYQNWMKLDAGVHEEWIQAGRKIQPQLLVR